MSDRPGETCYTLEKGKKKDVLDVNSRLSPLRTGLQEHGVAVGILLGRPGGRVVDAHQVGQILLERGLDLGHLLQLLEIELDLVKGGQGLGSLDDVLDLAAIEVVVS